MTVFTPPATKQTPSVFPRGTPGQTDAQYFARRRFSGHLTGINVYLMNDNTITTSPNDLSAIAKVWFGGHSNPVTAAEATLLTAAGYGAYLT